jgi:hypothetical protein
MTGDGPIFLTPPERWAATWFRRSQMKRRTPTVQQLERKYGERGIAFIAAGFLSGMIGVAFGIAVVIMLQVYGHWAELLDWLLIAPMLIFCGLGIVRFRQAAIISTQNENPPTQ